MLRCNSREILVKESPLSSGLRLHWPYTRTFSLEWSIHAKLAWPCTAESKIGNITLCLLVENLKLEFRER
jgi:hypothetical protein